MSLIGGRVPSSRRGDQRALGRLAIPPVDLPDRRSGPGAHRLGQLGVLEDDAGLVLETEAAGEIVVLDRPQKAAPALGLRQIVDADGAREKSEAVGDRRLAGRARDPALEPAHRPGALPAEQDPLPPALAEDLIETVSAPDRNQVEEAAAPDVDRVLAEELLAEVERLLTQAKQGDDRGDAVALAEGAAEAGDLVLGVPARRRQQADPGLRGLGELDDQVADRVVAVAAVEVVTAEGEDPALDHGALIAHAASALPIESGRNVGTEGAPRKRVASRVSVTHGPRRSSL